MNPPDGQTVNVTDSQHVAEMIRSTEAVYEHLEKNLRTLREMMDSTRVLLEQLRAQRKAAESAPDARR